MTGRPFRLGLFAASPVYYQVPLYRRLAQDPALDFTAVFASSVGVRSGDLGYGTPISWDIDLLSGYRSVFLKNAEAASVHQSVLDARQLDIVPLVWKSRFDALWIHGFHTASHLSAALAQRLIGTPPLIRGEWNLLHSKPSWNTHLKRAAFATVYRDARGLYIGTQNRRWFERFGVQPSRLFFVPYCVDNDKLQTARRELALRRHSLLNEFGIPAAKGPIILTVSRLAEVKDPVGLLEAFRLVRAKHECVLVFVGTGPLESTLRIKVASDRIPDVVFVGFLNQSQIAEAYVCADIFALASKNEPWGMVVNEAMNFGLPIVTTDKVGCQEDLVLDGSNGLVVSVGNAQALAQALEKLVLNPSLRREFGRSSSERISRWRYDLAADGIREAVESLASNRG